MLDIKYIIENTNEIKQVCKAREVTLDVDLIIENYNKLKTQKTQLDNLRQEKNKLTNNLNEKRKQNENIINLIKEIKNIKKQIKTTELGYKILETKHKELMYEVPNLLDTRVPLGNEDREEFQGGTKVKFNFKPKTNWELLTELENGADFKTGIKIAGSRGWILKGTAARLQKAILAFATDFWRKKGYFEIIPPFYVNEEHMYVTGHYPQGKDEVYRTQDGKVFVGTGEIPILAMYANELINLKDLPIKIMAYTPCYRREAGTNKDDKGLYRTHQFDKLELIHIGTKEQANKLYELLFKDLAELYETLELPHRMITLRANDMAKKATIERDMELWFEAEQRWGEVGSYGLTGDFQARRGNIKYEGEGKREYVNTTYATGCVPNRILLGILNNNQQEDGTVKIPKVLIPYMGGIEKLE